MCGCVNQGVRSLVFLMVCVPELVGPAVLGCMYLERRSMI